LRSLMNPAGRVSLIGDNDSGRLHRLARREDNDFRYLMPIGAVLFSNSLLRLPDVPFSEEALFYLGSAGAAAYAELPTGGPEEESSALPDSGWYVLRRPGEYLQAVCGPNGQKFTDPPPGHPLWNGGHAHNDKLSVTYTVGGQEIL